MPDAAHGGLRRGRGRYRIVETLGEQSYAIGFRNNDYVRYYVEAALHELAADGTIAGPLLVHEDNTISSPAPGLWISSGIPTAPCWSALTRTPIR